MNTSNPKDIDERKQALQTPKGKTQEKSSNLKISKVN